jgi:hypothetical protein
MSIKYFLSIVLTSSLINVSLGQDTLKHSTLSLGVGLNRLVNKDQFQSPYTYRGTNLLIRAAYTRTRKKGMHGIDLTYSGGPMRSVVSPKATNKLLLFNYDCLFKIRTKATGEKLTAYLGPGIHTLFNSTNYLPGVELSKNYLSAGVYLILTGKIRYQLNKKSNISMRAGLQAFGVVYRPDFEIDGKTLTKITHIGKSNLVSARPEYSYMLNSTLDLTVAYDYTYFSFDEPRPIGILQNGLSIGFRKKI